MVQIEVIDSFGNHRRLEAVPDTTVYAVLLGAGAEMDSPCHGNGSCHKCRVRVDGAMVLACACRVRDGMTVEIPKMQGVRFS